MAIKNPSCAMEECPRFEFCNINKCILHPDFNKLENDNSDPAFSQRTKQKCIPKSIRQRIAKKWNLEGGGLTEREIRATKLWNALPEFVKQERIAKLKKNSPITRLSEKGCMICMIAPKKKDSSKTHIEIEKKCSKDRVKAVDLKPSVPVQQTLLQEVAK
jgi:hypothetical protein